MADADSPQLTLVVLRVSDLAASRSFYEAIGLVMRAEQHGEGPRHLSAVAGPTVFELYPIGSGPSSSGTRIGWSVNDLDLVLAGRSDAIHVRDGRRLAVLVDPDGHKVELTEHNNSNPASLASDRGQPMAHVHLRDSWVLDIWTSPQKVCFTIDAVLERDHPRFYWPPHPGEQHAYIRLRWCLSGEVTWNEGPLLDRPAVDASGESDFGGFDTWLHEDGTDLFEGDWGSVTVRGAEHHVTEVATETPAP